MRTSNNAQALEREREAATQEAAAMGERLAAALAEVQLREQSIENLQKQGAQELSTSPAFYFSCSSMSSAIASAVTWNST